MLVEQNTVMVEEREREIRQIVQSISDLNEIFRDLAGMVVEQVSKKALVRWFISNKLVESQAVVVFLSLQGTVLDRIDFNVEQACVKTEDGLQQLQKVHARRRRNNHSCVAINKNRLCVSVAVFALFSL